MISRDYEDRTAEVTKDVGSFLNKNAAYCVILEEISGNQNEINPLSFSSFDDPFTTDEALLSDSFTGWAHSSRLQSNLPISGMKESHWTFPHVGGF
jgi:hypothetical protein